MESTYHKHLALLEEGYGTLIINRSRRYILYPVISIEGDVEKLIEMSPVFKGAIELTYDIWDDVTNNPGSLLSNLTLEQIAALAGREECFNTSLEEYGKGLIGFTNMEDKVF